MIGKQLGAALAALGCAIALTAAAPASAAVLYFEGFDDEVLAPNSTIREGEVVGGVASFNDDETNNKAVFNVVEDFTSPVMTFFFEVVEPVVGLGDGTQTELMLRAGRGTGTSSIGSSDDAVELILQRDGGNRGGYLNNGNESVFVVVNNSAGALNIASPAERSTVRRLHPQQRRRRIRPGQRASESAALRADHTVLHWQRLGRRPRHLQH
jgi:hypothetical protein